MGKPRILVVDDAAPIRLVLRTVLERNNCEICAVGSAEEALERFQEFFPDIVLLDIVLPGRSGLDLLDEIKHRAPDTEVVMITGHASVETATRAMKHGAYTYLQKPFEDINQIWITVQRALEKRSLTRENRKIMRESEARSIQLSSDVSLLAHDSGDEDTAPGSELIDYFLDTMTAKLKVSGACVMLRDAESAELRVASSRGNVGVDTGEFRVRPGEGIIGFVAKSGEPCVPGASPGVEVARVGGAPTPNQQLYPEPFAMVIPIKADGEIIGVLATTARTTNALFSEDDIAHVSSLAAQFGAALDGSRRDDRLQKAYASLKATQEQLARSERFKAIGEMTAGLTHDFNNFLSVILIRAEFMQRELKRKKIDRDRLRGDTDTIIKAALQGAEAIQRIQNYTRDRKDEARVPVDLNAAVRDAVEITRPKWQREAAARGTTIVVQMSLQDLPPVTGNLLELTQVIENLIFNAVESMPNGGQIAMKTTAEDGPVVLEISDTGTGMDARTELRLFEPFFTTRPSAQGLGASIASGIIARHKGELTVQSILGAGTTFRITLPAQPETAIVDEPPVETAPGAFQPARILLVDDEEPVRLAYRDLLRSEGHEVEIASGGVEALAAYAAGKFDLVLTDLNSGPISGMQVAARIKRIDPGAVVILLTGRAIRPEEEPQLRGCGFDAILTRPCPLETVLSTIQRFLKKPLAA